MAQRDGTFGDDDFDVRQLRIRPYGEAGAEVVRDGVAGVDAEWARGVVRGDEVRSPSR